MTVLLIHTDAEIGVMLCQGFSEKNTFFILSNQLRQIFDDLYRSHILGRDKMGSSTLYNTPAVMWATLQSHEIISEFLKHKIKHQLSITSIFVHFIVTAKILVPLQEIS